MDTRLFVRAKHLPERQSFQHHDIVKIEWNCFCQSHQFLVAKFNSVLFDFFVAFGTQRLSFYVKYS